MRLIIIAILAILWLLFGIFFVKPCFDTQYGCKTDKSEATVIPEKDDASKITSPVSKVTGPLLFNWDKEGAVTGDGWDAQQQAILSKLKADEILEIIGDYRADEVNNTTFKNLGKARASEVAKLFKPPLSDDRIRLTGRLVPGTDADKTSLFKSASFEYRKNTEAIKEIDNKTRIYFPYSSVNKLKDREVEAYLDDVADRIKKTGEKVKLTGHTDSSSSAASNQRLGMRRANIVKQYLINKGVDTSKIITQSKGETEPVGDNNTKKGRAENRRTELEIIK